MWYLLNKFSKENYNVQAALKNQIMQIYNNVWCTNCNFCLLKYNCTVPLSITPKLKLFDIKKKT